MKKLNILACLLILSSCELFEVLDTVDPNNLSQDNAVVTANDAESVLTGAYAAINQDAYYTRMQPIYGPLLSGYMGSTTITTRTITFQAENNTVTPEENTLGGTWDDVYELANRATNVIDQVEKLDDNIFPDPERKAQILGEAHFLRALAHFDALRFWGRFWDLSSDLGIPLRLVPGDAVNAQLPRSTVQEVYNSVLEDLDVAIADAPDFFASYYASKQSAKALKARVALYAKQYAMANQLADDVLDDGYFVLELNYGDIFAKKLASEELIFGMYASVVEKSGHTLFLLAPSSPFGQGRYDYAPTQQFVDLISGDPRESETINITAEGPEVIKYPNLSAGDDPSYIIRLAEIYLIKAEALARGAGTVPQAVAALNAVRGRVGVTLSTAATADQVLAEIQLEKVKELGFEGSHEWFDAIRYGNISTFKPVVTSENLWVLPIPNVEDDPNNQIEQNPGY